MVPRKEPLTTAWPKGVVITFFLQIFNAYTVTIKCLILKLKRDLGQSKKTQFYVEKFSLLETQKFRGILSLTNFPVIKFKL